MEMFFFGNDAKITMDTLIALVALVVSVVSLGASILVQVLPTNCHRYSEDTCSGK